MGIFQSSGKFPKYYLYLPLYKEDIKSDPNNYRPISILPVVSKIIEKVIFKQLYEYLTRNNLLTVSRQICWQFFRPMHSTLTALLEATNKWYLNIDDGQINSVLFLDLKKAFDTVDHSILLKTCNFMVSTRMQFSGSNHTYQIAFRVLV